MAVQIPNEIRSGINSIYDQQRKAQLAQLQSARSNALRGLNQQKVELGQANYANRNQADVVNAQNVHRFRESMAANGLSGSGENVSGMVALNAARQNALGDLNTSYQNSLSDINNQIASVNDPSQQNSILADLEAKRSQALLDAYQQALADAQRQSALRASQARGSSTSKKVVKSPVYQQNARAYKTAMNLYKTAVSGHPNQFMNSFHRPFPIHS